MSLYWAYEAVDAPTTMHRVIATLLQRSGWTLRDAVIGGSGVTSWPDFDSPPVLADGDLAALQAPDALDVGCDDHVVIDLSGGTSTITFTVYRLDFGSGNPWDSALHTSQPGSVGIAESIAPTYGAGVNEFFYADDAGFSVSVFDASDVLDSGAHVGYSESLIRDVGSPTWELGTESDPLPAAVYNLDTMTGSVHLLTDAAMGLAEVQMLVDDGGLTYYNPNGNSLGGLPHYPSSRIILNHVTGTENQPRLMLRGIYRTSTNAPKPFTFLRNPVTSEKFLRVPGFAFGPLT